MFDFILWEYATRVYYHLGHIRGLAHYLPKSPLTLQRKGELESFPQSWQVVGLVQCGRNNPPVKKGSNAYCKSFLPFCLVTERVEVLPH
ncbi:MAG TPA: hypothetical protein V6C90_08840, partial [Coleofasciculaceae cyanobacterium]